MGWFRETHAGAVHVRARRRIVVGKLVDWEGSSTWKEASITQSLP